MRVSNQYISSRTDDAQAPWPQVLLDSVALRGSGHTPNKKRAEYWGSQIKWVSLKDAPKLDKGVITTTAEQITPAGLANSSAVLHRRGSVILLRDAGIGKSAILGADMAVSQHFLAWNCGPALNNEFLYYWFQYTKSEFERISNGSTIKTIGLDYFRQLRVPLPHIEEQRQIAERLSSIDQLLVSLDRLIAKKQAIKQGMMQQLLTSQARLPGFTKPWQRVRIEEVLVPRSERNTDGLNLDVLTCTKHRGFVRSLDYFKNQVFSRDLLGYRVIYRGDIGYLANHIEEGSIGVQEIVDRGLVSPIYVVMRAKDGVDTYFLQRQLKLESFRQEFSRVTNASVNRRGSLRWKEFSQITVLMPEPIEQHAISTALRERRQTLRFLADDLRKPRLLSTA
jgi:type I restriction enzyme S subunit